MADDTPRPAPRPLTAAERERIEEYEFKRDPLNPKFAMDRSANASGRSTNSWLKSRQD